MATSHGGGASTSPKAEVLNYGNIWVTSGGGGKPTDVGIFRIYGEIFGWKNARTGTVLQMDAKQVEEITWMRINQRDFALAFLLRLPAPKGSAGEGGAKDSQSGRKGSSAGEDTGGEREEGKGREERREDDRSELESRVLREFMGFREARYDEIAAYIKKHWKRTISHSRLASKGFHWGDFSLENGRFCLDIDSKRGMQWPLSALSGVTTNKNEICLEIDGGTGGEAGSGGSKLEDGDEVVEVRFQAGGTKDVDPTETMDALKAAILEASGLAKYDNDVIVAFSYKNCQMPPGRFDMLLSSNSIKLHGKSADFTIAFKNIGAAFLLPNHTGPFSHLLLYLINPLKKGQTKYPAVIVQIDTRKEVEVSLNVSDALLESLQRINSEIKAEMTAIEEVLVRDLFQALSGKPLITKADFRSVADGSPCFRCAHKISSGLFYPLNAYFIFIPKPVIIVRIEDVASVDLARAQGQQTRLFEFQLTLKDGTEYEFSSVDRMELQPLLDFLHTKSIKVRTMAISMEEQADLAKEQNDAEADDDDAEFVDENDDEDNENENENDDESDESDSERGERKTHRPDSARGRS